MTGFASTIVYTGIAGILSLIMPEHLDPQTALLYSSTIGATSGAVIGGTCSYIAQRTKSYNMV